MGIFSKRNSQPEPLKSLEEIQRTLNYCASYNGPGSTTDLEDRMRDQLERQGYEAEYQCGVNTYEIKPLDANYCYSCGYSHVGANCDEEGN